MNIVTFVINCDANNTTPLDTFQGIQIYYDIYKYDMIGYDMIYGMI